MSISSKYDARDRENTEKNSSGSSSNNSIYAVGDGVESGI